jgi:hypothetical protein
MAWTDVGIAAGGSIGSLTQGLFGKRKAPAYTEYENVDVGKEAGKAIQGNLDNWGDISDLVDKTNTFNATQQKGMLETALPGWNSMSRKMVGSYGDMFQNLASNPYGMPSGLESNIERLAAERGISTGGRGQFQDYSLLRDFGEGAIGNMAYTSQLFDSMTNALMGVANFSAAAPVTAQSFFVTPEQQIAQTEQANYLNWMGRNQKNAADADAWNWNRQNLVGGLAQGAQYTNYGVGQVLDMMPYTGMWAAGENMGSSMGGMGGSMGGGASGMGTASNISSIAGMFCWVAREVYGEENPKWLRFRDWMVHRAPERARAVYAVNGPAAARMIRENPGLRARMRAVMDRILEIDAGAEALA